MEKRAIRLMFSFQREILQFAVVDKKVYYTDKVWSNWIQVVPKDPGVQKKILMSRNKVPRQILKMFNLTPQEMEEYNNAKTDEDLADIVIIDARRRGCKLEKRMVHKA